MTINIIRVFNDKVMITKEMTWVIVEPHDTKICLKDHPQVCYKVLT